MKIKKIGTAETKAVEVKGNENDDYSLYLFKSPVILTIGGIENLCHSNTAILYENGISHRFRGAVNKSLKYDVVQFRPSSANRQYINSLDIPLNKAIEVKDSYILSTTISNFFIHYQTAGNRKTELGAVYMRLILMSLEEACTADENEINDIPRYTQLREIRTEMYDNPDVHISIDKLCRRLAVGRTHFHNIYSQAFGVTFRQDEIKSRIAYACRLLKDTELSVSVVAEKCGYETDTYFMRQFRQHMGCTPSEYRRKN